MSTQDKNLNARGEARTPGVRPTFPSSSYEGPRGKERARNNGTKLSDLEVAAILRISDRSFYPNSALAELLGVTQENIRLIKNLSQRANVAVCLFGEDVQSFMIEEINAKSPWGMSREEDRKQYFRDLERTFNAHMDLLVDQLGSGWKAPPLPAGWVPPVMQKAQKMAEAQAQEQIKKIEEKLKARAKDHDLSDDERDDARQQADAEIRKATKEAKVEAGVLDQFGMTRADWDRKEQLDPRTFAKLLSKKKDLQAQGLWSSVDWHDEFGGMRSIKKAGGWTETNPNHGNFSAKPKQNQVDPARQAETRRRNEDFMRRQRQNNSRGKRRGW